MSKKGFTLIEILAVIAILAVIMLASTSNFFGLIGSRTEFETEELYKYLNDGAYVYSIKHPEEDNVSIVTLIDEGYIDKSYGILEESDISQKCPISNPDSCIIKIINSNGEKKACVFRFNGASATGKGACS